MDFKKNTKSALSYFPICKVVACTLPQFTCRRPSFKDDRVEVNILFFGLKLLPKDSFLFIFFPFLISNWQSRAWNMSFYL